MLAGDDVEVKDLEGRARLALRRMHRAAAAGRGCRLSAAEVQALNVTVLSMSDNADADPPAVAGR